MRLFFLALIDLILLAVCVGYGEFPGFVVWLVLSFIGFYANRHYSLKQAELLMRAERDERRLQLEAARETRKRVERAPARPQLTAHESDSEWIRHQDERHAKVAVGSTNEDRSFLRCAECDAKNNAKREVCWQCKNQLRADEREPVESAELIESKRISNLRKMAAKVGPVCARCGALNDMGATRCDSCGRDISRGP